MGCEEIKFFGSVDTTKKIKLKVGERVQVIVPKLPKVEKGDGR